MDDLNKLVHDTISFLQRISSQCLGCQSHGSFIISHDAEALAVSTSSARFLEEFIRLDEVDPCSKIILQMLKSQCDNYGDSGWFSIFLTATLLQQGVKFIKIL